MNRHFMKEDMQTTNNHVKRISTSIIFKEMQLYLQWNTIPQPHQWQEFFKLTMKR